MDVRNVQRGMMIHHALDGTRRVVVERPDRSRVYATTRGVSYVQRPYLYRGQQFDHRTSVLGSNSRVSLYRPYHYGSSTLEIYAYSRFYPEQMYRWAVTPFNTPQPFTWQYTTNATPWFEYYRGYFTPESSYSDPVLWVTDYVVGVSLYLAYLGDSPRAATAPTTSATVTPEVKQKIAAEVGRQVQQESAAAQDNARNRVPSPGEGGVVQELGDGQTHVYVVNADLDLVDPTGRRCAISEGDVIEAISAPKPDTGTADAVVLASKGGNECERSAQVEIALADLQEMQNHMREAVDQALASNSGKNVSTVTPAYAAAAPPPDRDAANEVQRQQQIAAAAES
jgi:hypothetical protein